MLSSLIINAVVFLLVSFHSILANIFARQILFPQDLNHGAINGT